MEELKTLGVLIFLLGYLQITVFPCILRIQTPDLILAHLVHCRLHSPAPAVWASRPREFRSKRIFLPACLLETSFPDSLARGFPSADSEQGEAVTADTEMTM